MGFAEKLKQYRKETDLTQAELAEKLHVSQKAVSSWETGRTDPTMEQVIELCRIFDCSMNDLTGTRSNKVGDITIEDVLVRIGRMNLDEITAVSRSVQDRQEVLIEAQKIEKEKRDLEMRMVAMAKRLEAYQQAYNQRKDGDINGTR